MEAEATPKETAWPVKELPPVTAYQHNTEVSEVKNQGETTRQNKHAIFTSHKINTTNILRNVERYPVSFKFLTVIGRNFTQRMDQQPFLQKRSRPTNSGRKIHEQRYQHTEGRSSNKEERKKGKDSHLDFLSCITTATASRYRTGSGTAKEHKTKAQPARG